jgi:hypothetical protein
MRKLILLICLLSFAGRASAQYGDAAAYLALTFTPVGALPPVMTSTIAAEVQRSAQLALRYGYLSSSEGTVNVNSFGFGGVFPMGLGSTVTLTGGVASPECRGCDPGLMLSLGGDTRLTTVPFGSASDAARLTLSLSGEFGFGKPKNISSLWSGAVGLPIGLVSGGRNAGMRIVPFITPAFGFGTVDFGEGTDSQSGSRFMLGGGVGVYNRTSNIVLNLGFQHVAISDGGTQIGLALMLGGR